MSFDSIVNAVATGFQQFSIRDAIDILVIAYLIYKLIVFTKETRAYQVLKGVGIIVLVSFLSQLLGLYTISWLLSSVLSAAVIVLVILFQPELRRGLEHMGRKRIFEPESILGENYIFRAVQEMHTAIMSMSRRRVGALIVIEQKTGLADIISTGTRIEGIISGALIENIFEPNTPLHDGAIIIRGEQIIAAGCFLPLSDDTSIARELGTRHRAALGISSVSDSYTIVVSEETGVVSMAHDAKLIRYLDAKALKDLLESIFVDKPRIKKPFTLFKRRAKQE